GSSLASVVDKVNNTSSLCGQKRAAEGAQLTGAVTEVSLIPACFSTPPRRGRSQQSIAWQLLHDTKRLTIAAFRLDRGGVLVEFPSVVRCHRRGRADYRYGIACGGTRLRRRSSRRSKP